MSGLIRCHTFQPTILQHLETLRSPDRDLGERLAALDALMIPGLSREHLGSRRAYEPILANEVAARGEVRHGGVVYTVDSDGKLLRRLP